MAIITLTITVANIADVLPIFDRVRVYRSTTGIDGEYALITTDATEIRLAAGVTRYSFEDDASDAAYFYKTAYFSSSKSLSSPLSAPFSSVGDPALSVLSVQQLKDRYLFGISLEDSNGNPIPDAVFENEIKQSFSWVESQLDLVLLPTPVLNEKHDYIQREVDQFFWTYPSKKPVQSVQAVRLHVPGTNATTFPASWYELSPSTGSIEVVPQGSFTYHRQVGFSPYYTQAFLSVTRRRIPNAIEIDYTAGFPEGKIPGDILSIVGKSAAIGPLRIAGNILLGAGVAGQSISIDGLGQSISLTKQGNGAFAAMINDFQQDIAQALPIIKGKYHGINVRTV